MFSSFHLVSTLPSWPTRLCSFPGPPTHAATCLDGPHRHDAGAGTRGVSSSVKIGFHTLIYLISWTDISFQSSYIEIAHLLLGSESQMTSPVPENNGEAQVYVAKMAIIQAGTDEGREMSSRGEQR